MSTKQETNTHLEMALKFAEESAPLSAELLEILQRKAIKDSEEAFQNEVTGSDGQV